MTLASELKVALHRDNLQAYINNERVVPVSLEMDITSHCDKGCHNCPSTLSSFQHNLDFSVVQNLFAELRGKTKGLLISGGEPTGSPIFADTLAEARRNEFEHIAVVSNGSKLGNTQVRNALLEHGSVIRISIYGWNGGPDDQLQEVFSNLATLREEIESSGSPLEIGMSFLTDFANVPEITRVVQAVKEAGAHWLYLHPRCEGWEQEMLVQLDQEGVTQSLDTLKDQRNGFHVYHFPKRYRREELFFTKYHSGHFLMVLGADGNIYLGTETKYNPQHIIGRVDENWRLEDLYHEDRMHAIESMGSNTYFPIGGRHRGCLYNDLIEKLVKREMSVDEVCRQAEEMDLRFKNIL